MNKLYVIKFMLKGDFCISRYSCWNPSEAKAKMDKNYDFKKNETDKIWWVREVNSTEVDIEDKLSDNLYVFNKDTKKIEIAVDDKEQKQFIDMRRGR